MRCWQQTILCFGLLLFLGACSQGEAPTPPNVWYILRDGGQRFGHGPGRRAHRTAVQATASGDVGAVGEAFRYPDVPVVHHPEVTNFVRYFTKVRRSYVSEALARRRQYLPILEPILAKYGVPRQLTNIAFVESRFQPNARTPDGFTVGMWQLSAATARRFGLRVDGAVDERRDVAKSTEAAAKYFVELYDQFGDWYLVVAAYNSGPARVQQAVDALDREEPLDALDVFALTSRGLVSDITREFVAKFGALVVILANLDRLGFEPGSGAEQTADTVPLLRGGDRAAIEKLGDTLPPLESADRSQRRTRARRGGKHG